MALNIFGNYKIFSKPDTCKKFSKPDDVLNDVYLNSYQKNMILESMLAEIRDEIEVDELTARDFFPKNSARKESEILKAQSRLKSMMI